MTTIRDVAALAGVSVATVSRALSGSERVTAATREKVQAAADELHYRPNAVAAAMRTGRTGAIGLVIGDLTNPFMIRLAGHAEQILRARGWVLSIAAGGEDPEEQERVTTLLLRQRVDGLLIVLAGIPTMDLERLTQAGTPVVALDRSTGASASATILNDPTPALRDLAQHLRDEGYERPAIICGPENISTGLARGERMRDQLAHAGYESDAIEIRPGPFDYPHGRSATAELLDSASPPDVIIALANAVSRGALAEMHARGITVGPEVGLSAYDDEPWFELTDPPLTCITQPLDDLVRVGVETLADLIAGETVDPTPAPMSGSTLVKRASTSRTPRH